MKWPRGIPISSFIEIHVVDCFGNTQDRHSVFRTISALRFCISFEPINFISQKQVWSLSLAAGKKVSSLVSLCYRPPTKLRQGNVFSYVYPPVCSWGGGLTKQDHGFPLCKAVPPSLYRTPALPPPQHGQICSHVPLQGPSEICSLFSLCTKHKLKNSVTVWLPV